MGYQVFDTDLDEVKLLEADAYVDARGSFTESFNLRAFEGVVGTRTTFVQDNEVQSGQNVLRGLHFQLQHPQGKLVRVVSGEVFDVAVDMRRGSRQYGQWTGVVLSRKNRRQLWIPPGFAHGYYVLGESADVFYKTTDYRAEGDEYVVAWNDPILGIEWPLRTNPHVSTRDACAPSFTGVPSFA